MRKRTSFHMPFRYEKKVLFITLAALSAHGETLLKQTRSGGRTPLPQRHFHGTLGKRLVAPVPSSGARCLLSDCEDILMKIVGIVAEYDPFHNGHQYHLEQALKLSGASSAVTVLSSWFTQRGDPALISPYARARSALACGVGAVFALPVCWVLRDAEHYALGAVSLLNSLGVDSIAFGAEHPDLPLLRDTADFLDSESSGLSGRIREHLQTGKGYPAALSSAVRELFPEAGVILESPNDILAVSYIRALKKNGSSATPIPVPRLGSHRLSHGSSGFVPASQLRSCLSRGGWENLLPNIPECTREPLLKETRNVHLHRPDSLDRALIFRLRQMSDEDYRSLPDLSEGLGNALRSAALRSGTRTEILDRVSGRRYPRSRINRLCSLALLGISSDQLRSEPLPSAAWLLGFRRDSGALLHQIKGMGFPLISRPSDWEGKEKWFQTEVYASGLWELGASSPSSNALTQKMVVV